MRIFKLSQYQPPSHKIENILELFPTLEETGEDNNNEFENDLKLSIAETNIEKFLIPYLIVQYSGAYNMFTEAQEACELMNISGQQYKFIMKNYGKLLDLFPHLKEKAQQFIKGNPKDSTKLEKLLWVRRILNKYRKTASKKTTIITAGQQHTEFVQSQLPPLIRRVKSIVLAAINKASSTPYQNPEITLTSLGIHTNGIYNQLTQRYSGQTSDPATLAKIDKELQIAKSATPQGINLADSSDGWFHYVVNGDCQKNTTRDKIYISIEPSTFTSKAFTQALSALSSSGFKGQIKIIGSAKNMGSRFDNIVIHACDPTSASKAQSIMKSSLQSSGVKLGGEGSTTSSIDAYGKSGNDLIANQASIAIKNIVNNKQITSWQQLYNTINTYFNEQNGTFIQYMGNLFLKA